MNSSTNPTKEELPDIEEVTWVCTVCGYVHTGFEPPDKCPKCGAPKEKFQRQ